MLLFLLICILIMYMICVHYELFTNNSDQFKYIENVILPSESIISKTKINKQNEENKNDLNIEQCVNPCYNNSNCKGVTIDLDYDNDNYQCISNSDSKYIKNEFTKPINNVTKYVSYINKNYTPQKYIRQKTSLKDKLIVHFQRLNNNLDNMQFQNAKEESRIIEDIFINQCSDKLNNII